MLNKIKNISLENKILFVLLLLSGLFHGYNMFHFPYYENDEGVYMSQAWSILKEGKLSPYTYWYDHAPLGWIFIALWAMLSGGFFTFGFSVNSGRVLMLIIHLLSIFFLFKITTSISKNVTAAIIAVLLFSLSPLGLYYERRVLLDNIMIFWFLLSLYIVLLKNISLRHVVLSAFAFGLATLSKENAIFFLPALLLFLYWRVHKSHRIFALGLWVIIVVSMVSSYFLFALLKGEFFPTGTFLGGANPHVSIIDSFHTQLGRGAKSSLTDFQHNLFWIRLREWIDNDAGIIYLGIFATLINLFLGIRNRLILIVALFSVSFWIFLLRGGVVLEFYIIPLLPILAMNTGIAIVTILGYFQNIASGRIYKISLGVVFLLLCLWYIYKGGEIFHQNLFTSDQTTPQIQAIDWMKTHTIPGSFVVIDNYGYVEMHDKTLTEGNYAYAEWYWKVEKDPEIRQLLHNNPDNITYIGQTKQMQSDIEISGLSFVGEALKHASVIKQFYKNNWGISIWATHYPQQILSLSWDSYKNHFLTPDGATIDPYRNNAITSEAQSYTLLRSVWMGDKDQFDTSWQWTKLHLQKSQSLFSWYIEEKDNRFFGKKLHSATDADEDIALALVFAYSRWHDETYLQEAKKIVKSIWNFEIKTVDKHAYLTAGDWEKDSKDIIINPSYFAPYEYRIFSQIDQDHDWKSVIETSYTVLGACSEALLNTPISSGLPPNWCSVSKTGDITQVDSSIGDSNYSYDAFRIPWRLALDYMWYHEPRAKEYFLTHQFLTQKWAKQKQLLVGYTHDGKVNQNYESAGAYAANLGAFMLADPKTARDIYMQKILPKFYTNDASSYWEDPKNYYVQNWAWFGTSLYFGKLENIWDKRKAEFGNLLMEAK